MAQNGVIKKFMKLPSPEKIWVVFHPFKASKAREISVHAREYSLKMVNDPDLDGDYNGGQVDAFRHGYWMALLTQEIGAVPAKRLGIAHEKGNKIQFRKKELEEGSLPDYTACEMDLKNNEQGIIAGKEHPGATHEEMVQIIKHKLLNGEFFIIKKNTDGEFLNSSDEIIPEELYRGLWHNPKTLVPSNYKRPQAK